jgi:hypothetical protein
MLRRREISGEPVTGKHDDADRQSFIGAKLRLVRVPIEKTGVRHGDFTS